MSSAVNKSQKRFMPKIASRAPAARGPGRRPSKLRTSFSVPNMPTEQVSGRKQSTAGQLNQISENGVPRSQALGLNLSDVPDEAIEDDPVEPVSQAHKPGQSASTITPTSANASESTPEPTQDSTLESALGSTLESAPESAPKPVAAPAPAPTAAAAVPATGSISDSSAITVGPSSPSSSTEPAASPAPSLKRKPSASVGPSKRLSTISRPKTAPVGSLQTPSTAMAPPPVSSLIAPSSAPSGEEEYTPPEGCEFVDLDSIPQLKMNERRRKMAFEREFVTIMRDLYTEKEKERLAEVSDFSDEFIEIEARNNAMRATYHQLKQAVGAEARAIRDKNNSSQQATDSETPALKPIINEKKTTMATLCKDLPFGEQNTAFDDYELARVNRRRDTMRVFKAKMWARGLYQPKEDEKALLQEAYRRHQDERKDRTGKIKTEQQQKISEIDHDADSSQGDHPQAAIEIQADGSISLVGTQYDRHQNNRAQRDGGAGTKTEVDPTEQVINSFSFSTKERPDRWTKDETEKFYEAVSALGTDFNLISHLFPTRSRNQIKTKFKYEEKRNPAKLHIHMVSRRKFNLDSYSKVSNVDIQEVETIESELENIRREHNEQMKLEEAARREAKVEDQRKLPATATTKRERM